MAQDPYRTAAGAALLFHVSSSGGSHGPGIDEARAEAVAKKINGPELLALLENAAREGAEDADRRLSFGRARIIDEVRRLAEKSDSLALHLFIEKEARDAGEAS